MPTKDAVLQWRGLTVVSSEGDKVGDIEEIYLDLETSEPEWAFVHTGLSAAFVPIANAHEDGGSVTVPFATSQVADAPQLDPDGELSQSEEAALYRHYGLDYSESRSDSGLPEGKIKIRFEDGPRPGLEECISTR